ncbi:hypothetical protein HK096_002873 [Nowakowskiella sp. JEL0078]|nr:hypothetical protein HK096_002873 [Nowakowskiella sp. JEL0078]
MPVSPVKHSVSRSQSPATSIRNKYRGLENTESNDYTMRSAIESNDRLNFEELERGRVEIELERWCTEHGFVARVQVDEINGTTNGFRGIVFVDDEMIVSEGVKETQKEAREAAVASAMDLLKDRVKLNFGEDYVNSNDAAKTAEPTEWDHTVSASPHDTSSSTTLTHPPPSADPIIPQQVPFLASPPDSNLFPLHYAAYTGNLSQIRHLLSGAQKTSAGMPIGIHVPDPTHRLPVSYLAQCSDPKIRNAAWIDEAVDLLTTSATNTSLPPLEIVNYIDAGAMSPLAWSLLVDAHIARALDADKRGVPEFALVAGGGWVAKVVVSRLSQVLENCGADMRAKRVGTTCAHWLVREAVEGRGRSEGVPWVLAVWAARKTGFDVCALDIQGREAIEYVEASSMFKESLFFVREKFGGRSIGKV